MKTSESVFGEPSQPRPCRAARLLRQLQLRHEDTAHGESEPDVFDRLLEISAQPFPDVPIRERGILSIATYYTDAGRLVLTATGPYLRVVTADLAEGGLTEWSRADDSTPCGTQLADDLGNSLRLHMSDGGPALQNADGSIESLKPLSELLREAARVTLTLAHEAADGRTA